MHAKNWKRQGRRSAATLALGAMGLIPGALAAQEPGGDPRIPSALRAEHAELHAQLATATKLKGPVGDAARELARIMHPHFVREEQIALPPLGLLGPLSRGESDAKMAAILPLTDSLEAELPRMLDEHKAIAAATRKLEEAARKANDPEYVRFAESLLLHAQTEEQITYPASILVGRTIKRQIAPR